jgi:spermidine synthase
MVIYSLFFASGAASLIYEVLWVRILGLSLGVTVYATSLVLMAFMGGLALGSAVWGRFIDRRKTGFLRTYAWLELAIGISAFAVSLLFIHMSKASVVPMPYAALCVVFFILVLIPTFFMGGTLPVMAKYLVKHPLTAGKDAGMLYAINTIGGVAGCFLTGFLLVKTFGVRESVYFSACINILVALCAFTLLWKPDSLVERPGAGGETAAGAKDLDGQSVVSVRGVLTVMILYGISGFCSLGYEVLWTRALMFKIGNDTYAFSLMLSTFLLGLGLGSFIFAKIKLSRKGSIVALGVMQLLIALAIVLGIGFLFRMDSVIDSLWQHFGKTWLSATAARFVSAFILMGIPTLLIGGVFPLAARLCSRSTDSTGTRIGGIYSANTVGTILGSGLAGFALLPLLGISRSIGALAILNALAGAAFLFLLPGKKIRLAGILCAAAIIPVCVFGIRAKPFPLTAAHLGRTGEKYDLLYYREGVSATVSVVKTAAGEKMLNVNGVYTAFTTIGDLQVHYMLGYLPYLFAGSDSKNALVIGLGLGVTSSSLVCAGENVDCVELAREEIGSSQYLADYSDTILSKQNFNLIIDDGRHYLLTTKKKYDVITSNAVHVRMSPYLYTQEFYRLCRDRMTDNGAVCQWLPTNNIPEREFKQLLKAFAAVFPHTTVWYVNPGHFLLLGTRNRLAIDCGRMGTTFGREKVRTQLVKVGLENPAVFANLLLMDEDGVSRYIGNVPAHTDDRPAAEFVRVLEMRNHDINSVPQDFCVNDLPLATDAACNESYRSEIDSAFRAARISRTAEAAQWAGKLSDAAKDYAKAFALYPGDSRTAYLKKTIELQIIGIFLHAGDSYTVRHDFVNAMKEYNQALEVDSSFYRTLSCIAVAYKMQAKPDSSLYIMQKAALLNENLAVAHFNLAMLLLEHSDFKNALPEYAKTAKLDPTCADAYFGKGFCLFQLGDKEQANALFKTALAKGLRTQYAQMVHQLTGE